MSGSRSSLDSTTSTSTSTEEKHKSTTPSPSTSSTSSSITSFLTSSASSTEERSRFSQQTHKPHALGEVMPVYLPDVSSIILDKLDGDVITHWQGDKETKKFSSTERQQFKLFGNKAKELVDKVGSDEAALVANLILRGEEKDVDEALALVKKNPDLLRSQCIAIDPLKRRVLGTPFQIAAMAGDVNLIEYEIKEEKDRGLVERLKSAACLSDEEVSEQLREVLTSVDAVTENEKHNQRILNAIKAFGVSIIQKAKECKEDKEDYNNFRKFQTLCQPLIDQLEKALTPDLNEIIKSGYIFDPAILQKAAEWFEENIKRFGGWWSIASDVWCANGFGKLQSKLSSRDAQVSNAGIGSLVDDKKVPKRSLQNIDGSSYFYNSSSRLGVDFYLTAGGRPVGLWAEGTLEVGRCAGKLISSKNCSVAKLIRRQDNAKQSSCSIT